MFKKVKKYVSAVLAASMVLTSVTSTIGATVKVDNDVVTDADTVPDNAFTITVTPENKELKKDDEFYVDFVVANNPGFSAYGFTVNYDPEVVEPLPSTVANMNNAVEVKYDAEDPETGEMKKSTAIAVAKIRAAINAAANGSFAWGDTLLTVTPTTETTDNGVMFRIFFKAKVDNGKTDISLRNKDTLFFSDKNAQKITDVYVKDATVQIGDDSTPALPPKFVKIDNDLVTDVDAMDNSAFGVTVKPSKESPAIDEEFYVDFVVANNPGFSAYGFTVSYDPNIVEPLPSTVANMNNAVEVKYDSEDPETGEMKKSTAIAVAKIRAAINAAANGSFAWGDTLLTVTPTTETTDNGIMFRIYFKAKANGSSYISLRNKDTLFFSDKNAQKITGVYVADGVVTVGGKPAEGTTAEVTTEGTTAEVTTTEVTTTAPTTSKDDDNNTTTSEPTTSEPTTSDVDDTTEVTTKAPNSGGSSGSSSGHGGGSTKRPGTTTSTTNKDKDKDKDTSTDKNDTDKPSDSKPSTSKPSDSKPSTSSSKGVSFVTKTGVKINVPKVDSSKEKKFKDVKPLTPWASNAIDKLSAAGIINGKSDEIFDPKGNTTRGDFMVMIAKTLGLEGTPSSNFSDVAPSKYYYNAIGLTKQIGIASGVGGDKFDPEATVTREQVMAITARVLTLVDSLKTSDASVLNKFVDKNNISSYAVQNIADLVGMGIVNGDTQNKINPKNNITRAETAVIMSAVYDIVMDKAEEMAEAATETTTEATTEDEDESESESKSEAASEDESEAVDGADEAAEKYSEALEYFAAFSAYALSDNDDTGKTLNDRFNDDYKDDYELVYSDISRYIDKYDDAKEVEVDEFIKDTEDFLKTLKNFGDEIDLDLRTDDSKKAIKDAEKEIKKSVDSLKKVLVDKNKKK